MNYIKQCLQARESSNLLFPPMTSLLAVRKPLSASKLGSHTVKNLGYRISNLHTGKKNRVPRFQIPVLEENPYTPSSERFATP